MPGNSTSTSTAPSARKRVASARIDDRLAFGILGRIGKQAAQHADARALEAAGRECIAVAGGHMRGGAVR